MFLGLGILIIPKLGIAIIFMDFRGMMDGGWVHDIEKSEVTILEGVFFLGGVCPKDDVFLSTITSTKNAKYCF